MTAAGKERNGGKKGGNASVKTPKGGQDRGRKGGRAGGREGGKEGAPAKFPAIQAARKLLFSNASVQGVMNKSSRGKYRPVDKVRCKIAWEAPEAKRREGKEEGREGGREGGRGGQGPAGAATKEPRRSRPPPHPPPHPPPPPPSSPPAPPPSLPPSLPSKHAPDLPKPLVGPLKISDREKGS
jgi:hypothetical protein